MSKLYNIKNWTRQNLWAWMVENAETQSKMQAFRADQIFYWLYQQKVESFAEMLNISQEIRKMLEEHFWISSMKIAESQKSQDGSIKYRLLLEDGTALNVFSCLTQIIIRFAFHPRLAVVWAVTSA